LIPFFPLPFSTKGGEICFSIAIRCTLGGSEGSLYPSVDFFPSGHVYAHRNDCQIVRGLYFGLENITITRNRNTINGDSMKVTTKGQVTIPLHVRKALGIEPHSEVDFEKTEDGGFRLIKIQVKKPESRFARLRGIATRKMTTDEIMTMTRGDGG